NRARSRRLDIAACHHRGTACTSGCCAYPAGSRSSKQQPARGRTRSHQVSALFLLSSVFCLLSSYSSTSLTPLAPRLARNAWVPSWLKCGSSALTQRKKQSCEAPAKLGTLKTG